MRSGRLRLSGSRNEPPTDVAPRITHKTRRRRLRDGPGGPAPVRHSEGPDFPNQTPAQPERGILERQAVLSVRRPIVEGTEMTT